MLRAEGLARDRPELALLLGRRGCPALKDDLCYVTSIEVPKKLPQLLHDSNIIVKIWCESNHNAGFERAFPGFRSGWNSSESVRLTGITPHC
jgi:hypothetical protein